jgi:histone deacetylase HOS3
MVQAASASIHGPHGQYIENVHLEPFESEEQFWNDYRGAYSKLLNKAEDFVKSTGGVSDDTLVFIRQVHFGPFIAPDSDVTAA